MPYGVALAVWQAVTLGLYVLAIHEIYPVVIPGRASHVRNDVALASSCPRVPGRADQYRSRPERLLTAALLGAALVQLDRRPTPRRYSVRSSRLQTAIRADNSARAAAADVGAPPPLRLALLAARDHASPSGRMFGGRSSTSTSLTRLDRARTGRYRLVQKSKPLRLGAHVGRVDPARLRASGRR